MRSTFLLAISLLLTSCLKKEVLDLNTESGNFQETEFYTSGKFDSELSFTVVNLALITFQNANGDIRCSPEMVVKLEEAYTQKLSEHWSNNIRITLYRGDQMDDPREFEFRSGNYSSPINYTHGSIDCDRDTISIDYQLQLIDPVTGRISATADKELNVATP